MGALAASAVVSAGSRLATHQTPGIRFVVGYAATGLGLATTSMVAPGLAGSLALLILTTTVFVYGEPFMDAITNLTSSSSGTGPASVPAAPDTTNTPDPAPTEGIST